MESKTIMVKRQGLCGPLPGKESCWYRTADSRIAVVFPFQEFDQDRELEVTISIVASPEERLREARLKALEDADARHMSCLAKRLPLTCHEMLDIIERVDAEFAKEKP